MKVVKIVTHHKCPEKAAELFYNEGVVAVGWTGLGDIRSLTKEEIMKISQKKWGTSRIESEKIAGQLITFRDKINEGDIIIAYRKNNIVAMIGEVEGDYYFDDKNKVGNPDGDIGYANQRKVKWWEAPRNFHRSRLPHPLDEKVALPGTILICVKDYDRNEFIESLRRAGLKVRFQKNSQPTWWVEKTYVKGRPNRESGEYALGKALWSPQRDRRGADIYRNMRTIKKGDIILHLIDNESIVGVSVADKECDSNFTCLPNTEWDDGTGKRPGYLIRLRDYQHLDLSIKKEEILNEKNKAQLLQLRQSAYITRAPPELVTLINDAYKEKTGKDLPYFDTIAFEPEYSEVSHMLYKIAWHPGGYKGGFCGNPAAEACEAFKYIKDGKERQPCSPPDVYYCVDEHEAFADSGWKVKIHPQQWKELHKLSEGKSLVFLVAPLDKYKKEFRLVGFYTIKRKIVENGKVMGLEADRKFSSKFDFKDHRLKRDNEGLKKLFNIRKWRSRVSHEIISNKTAVGVLSEIYEIHKAKDMEDPDINLDAMKSAIERLRQKTSPQVNRITIHDYFLSHGFSFEESAVSAFYVALKTKGFVILAGLTGTGKTKLPQLFCELITDKDYQKLFVPVRPNWRDSKPLVGYFNPIEGIYQSTELLKLIEKACKNWDNGQVKLPFVVLLDEMNLARVEYYFADFLSILESGRDKNSKYTKEAILLHTSGGNCEVRDQKEIKLPPNLYFVGTVNLDETTYSFSPKVLDRAFVVEFWNVDLENYPLRCNVRISDESRQHLRDLILEDLSRNGKFLAYDMEEDVPSAIRSLGDLYGDLKTLNKVLQEFGLHFGYRVVNEIALFFQNAVESMKMGIIRFESKKQILDHAILMKVLPKVHGNRSKVEAPLYRILAWAIVPENWDKVIEEIQEEDGRIRNEYLQTLRKKGPDEFLRKVVGLRQPKYRKTVEKVARMLHQLYATGFASFL
jgi:5-methylcytosine-specific restriction endonuclease McrBC GTP-binding regulatory subunit McrB